MNFTTPKDVTRAALPSLLLLFLNDFKLEFFKYVKSIE